MVKSPKKVRILGSFKMYIEYRGICLLFSKKMADTANNLS
jgi:hypothetical protein